jgi:integrase
MSIYKRGKKYSVYVKTRDGGRRVHSTGTSDKPTAKCMDEMLQSMASRREWEFLDAVFAQRLTVPELFDAKTGSGLDALRDRLADVDLQDFIAPWQAEVLSNTSETSDTAQQYLTKVRTLIPDGAPWYRSQLTYDALSKWLSSRPVSGSTKRKCHAAVSSFCGYLLRSGILKMNPMRDVQAPAANPPRTRYLDLADVWRLVDATAEPYRTVSALIHGTGLEISVALKLQRQDFDRERREVRARGTKNANRDRVAVIAEWAWRYVEPHLVNALPNAPVFPNTDRWRAADAHNEACGAIGIGDYHMHDARHSYAVTALRAGAPFEVVAHQLGHVNTNQVVSVYGRFKPNDQERRSWEQVAVSAAMARRHG